MQRVDRQQCDDPAAGHGCGDRAEVERHGADAKRRFQLAPGLDRLLDERLRSVGKEAEAHLSDRPSGYLCQAGASGPRGTEQFDELGPVGLHSRAHLLLRRRPDLRPEIIELLVLDEREPPFELLQSRGVSHWMTLVGGGALGVPGHLSSDAQTRPGHA
ncbi:hypothetical protein AA0Z99_13030 [Agrococcus sp. 1P02AA]|uniref:hypothetical protein n=1 Tax=Agrococcus sp. 1P02AA TaxID=3132259 RepID=UPI0039A463CA